MLKETAPPQHEHNGTQRFIHYVRMRTQKTIEILCGYNGMADTTGRSSRSVVSACGHNGTIKIICGHNGTMDKRECTSRSVVSACGHNGTIKFVCGHNGTVDTTGRNKAFPSDMECWNIIDNYLNLIIFLRGKCHFIVYLL